jgi:vacuolar protein sorting-associated protein 41
MASEVVVQSDEHVDVEAKNVPTDPDAEAEEAKSKPKDPQPGHCAQCHEPFTEYEIDTLLGYACGHVYHVSHLLELLHKGKKVDVDLDFNQEEGARYSVGMKVMRARLLRDKVRDGCPLCHQA